MEEWKEFLHSQNISHGHLDEAITKLCEHPELLSYPVVVAKGTAPKKGESAWLHYVNDEDNTTAQEDHEHERTRDYKHVLTIPMAEQGEVVARKVMPTEGESGSTLSGVRIPGILGNDFTLRNGKNTTVVQERGEIVANVSGQLSIEGRRIHVYPVYEVNGDISMQTGNIRFNGNVVIRGSVPSGYRVEAKGDVRITGIVKSADIHAEGSVYIHQGIAAQGKGRVVAGYNIECGYINQGIVTAGNNIIVSQSIIHSRVDAGQSLICNTGKGNIIGGKNSAGKNIRVREAGNHLNTPTALYIGVSEQRLNKEKEAKRTIEHGKEELKKLQQLKHVIAQKEKAQGFLSMKDRVTRLRIRNTMEDWITKIHLATDTIREIEDQNTFGESVMIVVEKATHMNTVAHFGKYRKSVTKTRHAAVFQLDNGEIVLTSM
ncbi:hypothetical protein JCM19037_232 [Geomicrobium sp. JCM 19037]|nr:hypothetical protein JCM19037_232 [Geomicrobium sp. JCM 19037]